LAKIFDIKNVLFAEKSSARRGDEESDGDGQGRSGGGAWKMWR
jgi:hypothetical protein